MDVKDYLWYPYLKYQAECREKGKEDSIQEWLELTGKVAKPKPKKKTLKKEVVKKAPPVKATTQPRKNLLRRKKS
tara:strand:+ start:52 stop:276 length:225 start_codon:yes stop_codon:yes gene_type:complete